MLDGLLTCCSVRHRFLFTSCPALSSTTYSKAIYEIFCLLVSPTAYIELFHATRSSIPHNPLMEKGFKHTKDIHHSNTYMYQLSVRATQCTKQPYMYLRRLHNHHRQNLIHRKNKHSILGGHYMFSSKQPLITYRITL